MHGPGDVRIEDLDVPSVVEPTDAVIEVAAACICGSDLWPYRGLEPSDGRPMGHEYVGTVPRCLPLQSADSDGPRIRGHSHRGRRRR